ncbi:hypothetical protein EJ04DRAFT_227849 [Polyplosphaeria fusca]|uniref:Uncharacterized protein n=1 Tax=Polyplosphaeria fusca TaxID=682080 RepID=A0A9P4QY16_9PLEO|nr:hypothetical protein EJ04DRAFT_227849 [Polyplosphaeria fusca]
MLAPKFNTSVDARTPSSRQGALQPPKRGVVAAPALCAAEKMLLPQHPSPAPFFPPIQLISSPKSTPLMLFLEPEMHFRVLSCRSRARRRLGIESSLVGPVTNLAVSERHSLSSPHPALRDPCLRPSTSLEAVRTQPLLCTEGWTDVRVC